MYDHEGTEKIYSNYKDSVLIDIVYNKSSEYEKEAVEIAKKILVSRGITNPLEDVIKKAEEDATLSEYRNIEYAEFHADKEFVKKVKDGDKDMFPNLGTGLIFLGTAFILDIYSVFANSIGARILWSLFVIMSAIYALVLIYKLHKIIIVHADNKFHVTPSRAVAYHFLPFYNFYWFFKWPNEIAKYLAKISNVKMYGWIVGVGIILYAGITSEVDVYAGILIYYSVLYYVSNRMKKALVK